MQLLEMVGGVIGDTVLPEFPDDPEPTIGETTIGMTLGLATSAGGGEVAGGPGSLPDGSDGELLSGVAIIVIAGVAEDDAAGLAALLGDGAGAREAADGLGCGEAVALIAKHDQELGGQDTAGAGERGEDRVIGMGGEEVADGVQAGFFLLDKGEEQVRAETGLVLVGEDDDGVRVGGRFLKLGEAFG